MKIFIVACCVAFASQSLLVLSESGPASEAESVRFKRPDAETRAIDPSADETSNSARGLLSDLSGNVFKKFSDMSYVLKEVLFKHHEKIGGLHYNLKTCLRKLLELEKTIMGLKEDKTYCPDYSEITDKIKDKMGDYVNPKDLHSMSAYLQSHLRNLDYRLRTLNRYLAMAFNHIKKLEAGRYPAPARPVYLTSPAHKLQNVKLREDLDAEV